VVVEKFSDKYIGEYPPVEKFSEKYVEEYPTVDKFSEYISLLKLLY